MECGAQTHIVELLVRPEGRSDERDQVRSVPLRYPLIEHDRAGYNVENQLSVLVLSRLARDTHSSTLRSRHPAIACPSSALGVSNADNAQAAKKIKRHTFMSTIS